MTSFEGTKGKVDDFFSEEVLFSSDGEVTPPHGRVLVFDNKGMVCDVVGIEGVTGDVNDKVGDKTGDNLVTVGDTLSTPAVVAGALGDTLGTSLLHLSSFLPAGFSLSGFGFGGGGGPFLALTGETSLVTFALTLVLSEDLVLVSLDFTALNGASD